MKMALMAVVVVLGTMQMGQSSPQAPDEAPIRNIIQDEVNAWNRGNAEAYSRHFAEDGTFTNILGMFFTGREAFRARHEQLFRTVFREVCATGCGRRGDTSDGYGISTTAETVPWCECG